MPVLFNLEVNICALCNETIGVLKKYNTRRHWERKHASKYAKYSGKFLADELEAVEALCKHNRDKAVTRASF
jgi:hypothetical protein